MKLAVTIDVDGDIMYVPEGAVFENFPTPKLFDNMEDAERCGYMVVEQDEEEPASDD